MVGRWTRVANSGASAFVAISLRTAVGSRSGAAAKAALCVPKLLPAPDSRRPCYSDVANPKAVRPAGDGGVIVDECRVSVRGVRGEWETKSSR